ncbi:MAG: hypothetical protein H0V54_06220 [Chthoniobacterales bacterium]|nr:hypothetical protein [Chthoniobacterales bacterium]
MTTTQAKQYGVKKIAELFPSLMQINEESLRERSRQSGNEVITTGCAAKAGHSINCAGGGEIFCGREEGAADQCRRRDRRHTGRPWNEPGKGGFKGFNQKSVSVIIELTDPRKQDAVHKSA